MYCECASMTSNHIQTVLWSTLANNIVAEVPIMLSSGGPVWIS